MTPEEEAADLFAHHAPADVVDDECVECRRTRLAYAAIGVAGGLVLGAAICYLVVKRG